MSMITYFTLHNRRPETLTCAMIFILSVFYISCTYEDIYDLAKIEENMETIGEFDEEAYMKWKNEYAHPLVVGNIRKREKTAMEKVFPVSRESQIGNMDHLFKSQNGSDYEDIPDRERNTGLFELTTHSKRGTLANRSPGRRNQNIETGSANNMSFDQKETQDQ